MPMMLEDGDILSLCPGKPEVVDSAPVGRLALDGNRWCR
jgi:ribonuclease J